MGDLQVGVANLDNKGFYGLMDKPVEVAASPTPSLQVSVSFGRFENDSLSWEKFSAFSPNKYLEEVGKCATPGSVAQKKAYFEAHYKKIAERKAEIMDQEKQFDNNSSSFRSVVTDQGSNGGSEVHDGSHGHFTWEQDKHVTHITAQVSESSIDEINEQTIIVKECQGSLDLDKEQVKDSVDSPKSIKLQDTVLVGEENDTEVAVHVQEIPDQVVQGIESSEQVREEILAKHTTGDTIETIETPMQEVKKEKKHNLVKKNNGNPRIISTRSSPKLNQVTTKQTSKPMVTSRKTPPSKEIKSMMKITKKPAATISKAPAGFPTPRVYKQSPSRITSLSTSHSSLKKENVSALLRNKQTAPKSLHISMSLGPSASDPTALTSTRKSLIMERMGDKDIVKRAFKSFQKSYDGQNTAALKQNPATATSIPSVATRRKENGRPTKASSIEKRSSTTANAHLSSARGLKSNETVEKQRKELSKSTARPVEKTRLQKNPKQAGVIDAKTRRDSLSAKAKLMQGSLPVRTLPKGSLDKVL